MLKILLERSIKRITKKNQIEFGIEKSNKEKRS